MNKKNSIKVGLIDGNTFGENEKPNVELLNEKVKEGSKTEEVIKPAIIISKVDYPITLAYGNSTIRVSGRAKEKVADYTKLDMDKLPSGISVKKL